MCLILVGSFMISHCGSAVISISSTILIRPSVFVTFIHSLWFSSTVPGYLVLSINSRLKAIQDLEATLFFSWVLLSFLISICFQLPSTHSLIPTLQYILQTLLEFISIGRHITFLSVLLSIEELELHLFVWVHLFGCYPVILKYLKIIFMMIFALFELLTVYFLWIFW